MKQFLLRLDDGLKKKLEEEAAFAHRSLNNLINYILTKHVYKVKMKKPTQKRCHRL